MYNRTEDFRKGISRSSPIPILSESRRDFADMGIDNPVHTIDITSEDEKEAKACSIRKHRDSIVSTASFERASFLELIGKDDIDGSYPDKDEKKFSRRRIFSLHIHDFEQQNNRFEAYLHNRFGDAGSELGRIRNATGIYHIYNGSVLVTDVLNNTLLLFSPSGRLAKCIPLEKGVEPWTCVATPTGDFAVTLGREKCISVLTFNGIEKQRLGENVLRYPSGIVVDRQNRFIVSDTKENKIFIFSSDGEVLRIIPDEEDKQISFDSPRHLTLSHSGHIIVSDSANHCIHVFERHGDHVRSFGKYGSEAGELKFPHGVCTDHEDNIIVADYFNNRVSIFTINGQFIQQLVTEPMGMRRPQGVSIRFFKSSFFVFITYGETKATRIASYRILDTEQNHDSNITAVV